MRRRIELPVGVTAADWAQEQVQLQNPRIRCMLGSIRVLEGAHESNFALLHCSPGRLFEIWGQVRNVASALRDELAPLLVTPSSLPPLNAAVREASHNFDELDKDVLSDLDRFPESPPLPQVGELRTVLCVAIGRLHTFLHDTLGRILAADPRSAHDADYFLSRDFARAAEETAWLDQHLAGLEQYLQRLDRHRPANLTALAEQIEVERGLPSHETWRSATVFFEELNKTLIPMLRQTLGLRGTRIDELQIMDMYARMIATQCRLLEELFETGRAAADDVAAAEGAPDSVSSRTVHDVFSTRLVRRMKELDTHLHDLVSFIPVWRTNIGQRRAFLLSRKERD